MADCWGRLTLLLDQCHTGDKGHPLAKGQPSEVCLSGRKVLVIGRCSESVLRVSRALAWISNKHFQLEIDDSGGILLRDTSSNGTWVNGERAVKDVPRVLCAGDEIELAASEGEPGEHRQVFLRFEAGPNSTAAAANPHGVAPPVRKAATPLAQKTPTPTGSPSPAGLKAAPASLEDDVSPSVKRQRLTSGSERMPTETMGSSTPMIQHERAGSQAEAGALAVLEAQRARADRAEAELAAAREAWTATSLRWRSEARDVLGGELRQVEDEARAEHTRLRDALTEHERERERLTQYASQASQDCQRAVQEKIAEADIREQAERKAEAALRHSRELEATLAAERAKCDAANEQVQRLTEEGATLRSKLSGIISELQPLVRADI